MQLKPGMRLRSGVGTTEIVVVRGGEDDVSLTCCGKEMRDQDCQVILLGDGSVEGAVVVGKRYIDQTSGIELLCTKGGPGPLACDGRILSLQTPKPLPSTD